MDITDKLGIRLVEKNLTLKQNNEKPLEYKFKIPCLPPSVNSCYKINFRLKHTYLSNEGKAFKLLVKCHMPPIDIKPETKLDVFTEYWGNWHTKENKVRKCDGMNLEKLLLDAISERIGIDDSYFFKWGGVKIQSTEECCWVKIRLFNKI